MQSLTKDPLISVIIPIYNVEKYLERCLNSVVKQSYSNLEIILVDDGSTDNSLSICQLYESKDERVRVYTKKNGGLSDARNYGIHHSKGQFVALVDSDDWISEDYVQVLYDLLVKYNADISVAELEETFTEELKFEGCEEEYVFNNLEAIEAYFYQRIPHAAYAKLYKREIFDSVEFPVGKIYEDWISSYFSFKKAKVVAYTKRIIYAHFVRDGSIVRSKFTLNQMDIHSNIETIIEDVNSSYPEFIRIAKEKRIWADIFLILKIWPERKKYIDEDNMLWTEIKQDRMLVITDRKARKINRILAFLSFGGRRLLHSVYSVSRMRSLLSIREKLFHLS